MQTEAGTTLVRSPEPTAAFDDGAARPSRAAVVTTSDGEPVVLPDGKWLTDSVFQQQGADLVVTGPDGSVIVVQGYFSADVPPILTSPEGGVLNPTLLRSFALLENSGIQTQTPLSPGDVQFAQSLPEAIGTVQDVTGQAFAVRVDGTRVQLSAGDPLYQGDVVETAPGAAANLLFIDRTTFSIGGDARLALDELVFNPATRTGTSSFSMLKGVFVFVSGQIAQTDATQMTVTTPVATIGIRGTKVAGDIKPPGEDSRITIIDGGITLQNDGGRLSLGTYGESTTISSFQSEPSPPFILTQQQMETFYAEISTISRGLLAPPASNDNQSDGGQTGNTEGSGGGDGSPASSPSPPAPDLPPPPEPPAAVLPPPVPLAVLPPPPPPPPPPAASEPNTPPSSIPLPPAPSSAPIVFIIENLEFGGLTGWQLLPAIPNLVTLTFGEGSLDEGVTVQLSAGAGVEAAEVGSIESFLGIAPGTLNSLDIGQQTVNGSALLAPPLTLDAQSLVSFTFAFDYGDVSQLSFPDYGFVSVNGQVTVLGTPGVSSGVQSFSTVVEAGNLLFGFGSMNAGDGVVPSFLRVAGLQFDEIGEGFSFGGSPGFFMTHGDFGFTEQTVAEFELGGLTAGMHEGFDRMEVAGTLTLGGTLDVVEYGGFAVSAGDRFEIVEAGHITGSFHTVRGLELGDDLLLDLEQTDTTVTLIGRSVTHSADEAGGTLVGTDDGDVFRGGAGNDTFVLGGGRDIAYGGDGDDVFVARDTGFGRLDGGNGFDVVAFVGDGSTFDLTGLRGDQLANIQAIDLTDIGAQVLRLDGRIAFAASATNPLTGTERSLIVDGGSEDTVELVGEWSSEGNRSIGEESYSVYRSAETGAAVYVNHAMAAAA